MKKQAKKVTKKSVKKVVKKVTKKSGKKEVTKKTTKQSGEVVRALLKDVHKRSFDNLYVWLSEVPVEEAPEPIQDYVKRARRGYGRHLGTVCRKLQELLYDVARHFEQRKAADPKLAKALKRMLANSPDQLLYGHRVPGNASPPVDGMIGGVTEAVDLTLQAGLAAMKLKPLALENYKIVLVSDYPRSFFLQASSHALDIIEAGVRRLHLHTEDRNKIATGLATAWEVKRVAPTSLSFWWD